MEPATLKASLIYVCVYVCCCALIDHTFHPKHLHRLDYNQSHRIRISEVPLYQGCAHAWNSILTAQSMILVRAMNACERLPFSDSVPGWYSTYQFNYCCESPKTEGVVLTVFTAIYKLGWLPGTSDSYKLLKWVLANHREHCEQRLMTWLQCTICMNKNLGWPWPARLFGDWSSHT